MNNILLVSQTLSTVLIIVGIMAVLALLFGLLIVIVSKFCHVHEDERIGQVTDKLAGANCGGCGYAGCGDYAKALVEGKSSLCDCNATDNEQKEEIAKILNIPLCASVSSCASVKCNGGRNAKDKIL